MGYIKFNNQITNFELDNMLFIKVYDMYDFYGKLLTNQIELCDHTTILNEKNYIITPSTRIKDIFSLAKTNIFGKKILEFSQNEQIDSEQLNDFSANTQIKKFLNNYFDYEDNFDIDINKLISLCFE
jgi:hypothetical protein